MPQEYNELLGHLKNQGSVPDFLRKLAQDRAMQSRAIPATNLAESYPLRVMQRPEPSDPNLLMPPKQEAFAAYAKPKTVQQNEARFLRKQPVMADVPVSAKTLHQ